MGSVESACIMAERNRDNFRFNLYGSFSSWTEDGEVPTSTEGDCRGTVMNERELDR